jgi:PTH1 family peptidyl-tRNA hydrolase
MKIIVGLGNPGKEYQDTRHNAGFALVDYIAQKLLLEMKFDKKFDAELVKADAIYKGKSEELCLIKPQTFMNQSGSSVRAIIDYYYDDLLFEGEENHIVIAHDDLDLPLGEFKIQRGKGPKTHNGLNSVYQHLGTKNFWHLRIGVDNRDSERNIPPADFVLKKMTTEEKSLLDKAIAESVDLLFA